MAPNEVLGRTERSATVAFAPAGSSHGNMGYLCAGTVAGAFDMSFSTTATLEIFSLENCRTPQGLEVMQKKGKDAQSHERFHRLAWGSNGSSTEEYSVSEKRKCVRTPKRTNM